MALPEQHIYVPQNSVANVINADLLGLYDLSVLPPYYQPTDEAIEFTGRLIERIIEAGNVLAVVNDSIPSDYHADMTNAERVQGRLAFLLGPAGLEPDLNGRIGADSWLCDVGIFPDALYRVT